MFDKEGKSQLPLPPQIQINCSRGKGENRWNFYGISLVLLPAKVSEKMALRVEGSLGGMTIARFWNKTFRKPVFSFLSGFGYFLVVFDRFCLFSSIVIFPKLSEKIHDFFLDFDSIIFSSCIANLQCKSLFQLKRLKSLTWFIPTLVNDIPIVYCILSLPKTKRH